MKGATSAERTVNTSPQRKRVDIRQDIHSLALRACLLGALVFASGRTCLAEDSFESIQRRRLELAAMKETLCKVAPTLRDAYTSEIEIERLKAISNWSPRRSSADSHRWRPYEPKAWACGCTGWGSAPRPFTGLAT